MTDVDTVRRDLAAHRGEEVHTAAVANRLHLSQATVSGVMRAEVEAGRAVRIQGRPGWYLLLTSAVRLTSGNR